MNKKRGKTTGVVVLKPILSNKALSVRQAVTELSIGGGQVIYKKDSSKLLKHKGLYLKIYASFHRYLIFFILGLRNFDVVNTKINKLVTKF
ncbi:hypothetical protein BpHYR1_017594 [Brachionus plicatilis]|uniref:Uncharacterized protein n=1 Tax=Brachionus plicatilis TaxID=10195 RepID=A0A3M7SD23_BRAPC|nr:hypothetical protein BpHYR1_017594 [Brachionus plicatilis]